MAFTFTAEQRQEIAKTRADKAKWERVIANATERLKEADAKLAAVATLNGGSLDMPDGVQGSAARSSSDSDSMTSAIEELANSGTPLSHNEMREKLRARGFPEDRLGNYYYTVVHRLKNKERIFIGPDKKIGPFF